MTQHVSARTGSSLAGGVLIYVAGLVAVTNAVFTAGVATTTHVPGGLARTGTYSVSAAAALPGVGALEARAADIGAADAGASRAEPMPGSAATTKQGPARPLAPVSVAGTSLTETPIDRAALRVSGLAVAGAHAAVATKLRRPDQARPDR